MQAYLEVVKYIREDLFLSDPEVWVTVIRVRADMNYAIHVQVQIIKLGNLQQKLEADILQFSFVS